ncbi:hypothetical protein [Methanobrevibacter sp.]
MKECEEYIQFVTSKIQNQINHQYSIQSRGLDYLTNYGVEKKIEVLTELAKDLGVVLE